jgi:serine/threonine protein kinase
MARGTGQLVPQVKVATTALPPPFVQQRGLKHLTALACGLGLLLYVYAVDTWLHAPTSESRRAVALATVGSGSLLAAVLLQPRRLPLGLQLTLGVGYWLFLAWALPIVERSLGWQQWDWLHRTRWLDVLLLTFPLVLPLRPVFALALVSTLCLRDTVTTSVLHVINREPTHELDTLLGVMLADTVPWPSAACAIIAYAFQYRGWATLATWQTWGSFTLRKRLSADDMGDTWALAPGRVKQHAVLQTSPATVNMDDETYERFETALQRVTALRSPHVATVYEYGQSERGAAYCVREHAEGMSWHELVTVHGTLLPERAIALLVQVCNALIEAHALGLVHGALSPRSLLLTRNAGEYDLVKVLNFGLLSWLPYRRIAAPRPAIGETISTELSYRGDVQYLAPELVNSAIAPTASSDIYVLGCLGYWLLAGRAPFTGDPQAVLHDHVHTPAPSLAALTTVRPPKDLEQILLDCLAKEPEQRPNDAHTVRRRLRACGAATHWHQGRAKSWWLEHVPACEPEPASQQTRVSRKALFRGRTF